MPASEDLSSAAVTAELSSARFQVGVLQKRWWLEQYNHPVLLVGISGTLSGVQKHKYVFRFELTGFPGTPPAVQIWDAVKNCPLAPEARPKGPQRVAEAFKVWGDHNGVYRPWERFGAGHNNWNHDHKDLLWHPNRGLTFILEDLHGLITSSALADVAQATT